jgi:bifunctional DNA-binding transcriptional regulator/antitoxin component of YhaV-PrlF toxin-antitoxin module
MKKEQIILKVDSKNRITLPKKISDNVGKLVQIYIKNGQIILEPLQTIPQDQAWLFEPKNKEVLADLKKSLKEKERISLGSFAKYLPKKERK